MRGTGRRAGRWFDRGRVDHAGETVKTRFDRKDDVACVELSSTDFARQIALDDATLIDYAADGSAVGLRGRLRSP